MRIGTVLSLAAVGQGAATGARSPNCCDLRIPVSISATQPVFPSDINFTAIFAGAAAPPNPATLPTAKVGGHYTIVARFCEPTRPKAKREKTLQLLVHGNTYTRNYWSGIGAPGSRRGQEKYSWIDYAAKEGYPTLSIDNLCNGQSSHLDPLAECQVPLEVEAINAVINAARAGSLPDGAARRFSKIVYVGHSFGSILANNLAVTHPSAVDAYILTGFTGNITNSLPRTLLLPQYEPAAQVDPARFGSLPPGYVTQSNATGARAVFYTGDFDPNIAALDFANRGTATTGELLTTGYGQAPAFTGPLFVLDGNEDTIVCEPGPTTPGPGANPNCDATGNSANVKGLYPKASTFAFFDTPKTGHSLNLHETAQRSFGAAHHFLSRVGY